MYCLIIVIFILVGFLFGNNTFLIDRQLKPIVEPHLFDFVRWQMSSIKNEMTNKSFYEDDSSVVIEYFELFDQLRILEYQLELADEQETRNIKSRIELLFNRQKSIEKAIENILETQIKDVLISQGIYTPLPALKKFFPPLNFILAQPPNILVVSPRHKIESINEIMIRPDITLENIEEIETRIEKHNKSALIIAIGGLGISYPTFVSNNMGLQDVINTATEEWLHQYLAFKPLGFRYVLDLLGVAPNYDIAVMNETLAGIVSKEIGELVINKYYRLLLPQEALLPERGTNTTDGGIIFDFNAELREIRKRVDLLLSSGQIEAAEEYMKERRNFLAANGYHIRKLNQAYFAFYGTYGDSPTSIDPIGEDMRLLRSKIDSLKEFVDNIAAMTSRQQLSEARSR